MCPHGTVADDAGNVIHSHHREKSINMNLKMQYFKEIKLHQTKLLKKLLRKWLLLRYDVFVPCERIVFNTLLQDVKKAHEKVWVEQMVYCLHWESGILFILYNYIPCVFRTVCHLSTTVHVTLTRRWLTRDPSALPWARYTSSPNHHHPPCCFSCMCAHKYIYRNTLRAMSV